MSTQTMPPEKDTQMSPPGGSGPSKPITPAWRLVMTLAVAGGLAGLLIVSVHRWTEPQILAHQARAIAAAVDEVLQAPARTETLYLHDNALHAAPPAGVDTMRVEKVWAGYDESGRRIGYAMLAGEPGFQDVIRLMFGYDAEQRRLLGMRVLESKETPGLGDKIEKDSAWIAQFRTAATPMTPVKPGAGSGADDEVDTITGATISARAVINIINNRLAVMQPLIDSYAASASAGGAQ
jgi:Na+-translocating ferredoxin:NAD+ oxidoreductase subunit G